jgi:hypothetical protein
MSDFDDIAELYQERQGLPLIDYIPLAMPCYLLQMDVLVSEKRKLLPLEEFVLRGLKLGLQTKTDVLGLVGLDSDSEYGDRLIESLRRDDLIGGVDNKLGIRAKGEMLLSEDGEQRIYEKIIPLLWDPISNGAIRPKLDLIRAPMVRYECRVRVVPKSVRQPDLGSLPLEAAQSGQVADIEHEKILRYLGIQKRTLMYRRGVLLLYGGAKGVVPTAQIAVDGAIDEQLSSSFARDDLLPRLGVDHQFNRRSGSLAVEQRVKPLGVSPQNFSLANLLRFKSALLLGIAGLEKQDSREAAERLEEKHKKLEAIERELDAIPIRELSVHEAPRLFDSALQKARKHVVITTTLPYEARLGSIRLLLLEQALRRGVQIQIFISTRPTEEEIAQGQGPAHVYRKLTDLMSKYRNFDVAFLRDTSRVVFEVLTDDLILSVCNEPSLGPRAREPIARLFAGYVLTGKTAVATYSKTHMSPQALEVVQNIRLPTSKPHEGKSGGRSTKGLHRS